MTDIATIDSFGRGDICFPRKDYILKTIFIIVYLITSSSGWPYDGLQVQQNSSDVKEKKAQISSLVSDFHPDTCSILFSQLQFLLFLYLQWIKQYGMPMMVWWVTWVSAVLRGRGHLSKKRFMMILLREVENWLKRGRWEILMNLGCKMDHR